MPKLKPARNGAGDGSSRLYWLLSLYSPAASDTVDWSGGFYEVTLRGGRIESPQASGAVKKQVRLIAEGSVLAANSELTGAAVDVAPDGFAHPVYRSGLALAIRLPTLEPKLEPRLEPEPPVEEASADTAFDNAEAAVREEEPPVLAQQAEIQEPEIHEPEVTPEPQPEEPPEPTEPPFEEPEPEVPPVTEPIPEAGSDPQPSAALETAEPQSEEAHETPVEPIPEAGGDPQPDTSDEEGSFDI
jgi:outer membrane biosynthesis protein TonB